MHVSFDKTLVQPKSSVIDDDDLIVDPSNIPKENIFDELPRDISFVKDHPKELVIGELSNGVQTRSSFNSLAFTAFVSQLEPKNVKEAFSESYWIIADESLIMSHN